MRDVAMLGAVVVVVVAAVVDAEERYGEYFEAAWDLTRMPEKVEFAAADFEERG